MKIKLEETAIELSSDDDFLFGYNLSPSPGHSSRVNPNAIYKFKRWTPKERCDTGLNCQISGKELKWFMATDQKCGQHRVYLMNQRPPYKEPECEYEADSD